MYSLGLLMMDGETVQICAVLFQNKINLRYCASDWFYYRNIIRCTVLQTLNRIRPRGDIDSLIKKACLSCSAAGRELSYSYMQRIKQEMLTLA